MRRAFGRGHCRGSGPLTYLGNLAITVTYNLLGVSVMETQAVVVGVVSGAALAWVVSLYLVGRWVAARRKAIWAQVNARIQSIVSQADIMDAAAAARINKIGAEITAEERAIIQRWRGSAVDMRRAAEAIRQGASDVSAAWGRLW